MIRPHAQPTGANGTTGTPLPNTTLVQRYRLGQPIGAGATAAVYRATDLVLDQIIAVKVLIPQCVATPADPQGLLLDLRREAVAAMRLSHPNIVRVFNYDSEGPWEFLVMEYLAGETSAAMRKRLPAGHLSAIDTVHLGMDCLAALAYAHELGVHHHDIKPSNIMMTRSGRVKLCDFGLARLATAPADWPANVAAGTPAYMSPERIQGGAGDHRSDLYALGATLYSLGNGRSPFGQGQDAWRGHLFQALPPSAHVPAVLHEVIERAMAKAPENRYASAGELWQALADVAAVLCAADPESSASMTAGRPTYPSAPTRTGSGHRLAAQRPQIPGAGASRPDVSLPLPLPLPLPTPAPRSEGTDVATDARLTPEPIALRPNERRVEGPRQATQPAAMLHPAAPVVPPRGMVVVGAHALCSAYDGKTYEVASYLLDATPVTNAAYADYVHATGEVPPAHWIGRDAPRGLADHPVVGITLDEARRFAAWSGKRLPTSLEWEAAARRPDNRPFPWGDAFDPARCLSPPAGAEGTASVDAHRDGASFDGCIDLVGNVWEWTETDPAAPPPDADYAWVLGGSFRHACDSNGAIARTMVQAFNAYLYLGFRCALST